MTTLLQDVRYGLRTLFRSPGFTVVAVLTLALGIGANSTIFTVVKGVLLEPLPYPDAGRLVYVWETNRAVNKDRDPVAPLNYFDWQAETSVFESLAGYTDDGFALLGVDDPEQVGTLAVTSSLFRVLGVEAAIGRTFTEEEERRRDRVVVLSHEFWQRRFKGDRTLIGKSLNLDGNSYTVVGVMGSGFRFPDGISPGPETYSPILFAPNQLRQRSSHILNVVGRLKDGVTMESASAHMNAVGRRIADANAESNPEVTVISMHEQFVENVRLGLLVLLGTAGFVLLIACANVANVMLARSSNRRREMALRASLGAGRWRIVRQLLTESLLVAVLGTVAGMVMASWLLDAFLRFIPAIVPRTYNVAIDAGVVLFSAALCAGAALLCGLAPTLQLSRSRLNDILKESGSRTAAGGLSKHSRSVFVVAEVAFSLILLAGTGLMIRSFANLLAMDYGFRTDNLLTVQLFVPDSKYPANPTEFRPAPPSPAPALSRQARFFLDVVDRMKALPGVASAAAVTALPLNPAGIDFDLPVFFEGRPQPGAGEAPQADFRIATIDYFRTMGIPLLQGREFTEFDGPGARDVVIVNDAFVKRHFPGENPVGKRIIFYSRPREIIGVVGSVRHYGFRRDPNPEMIVSNRQFQQFGGMTIVIRAQNNAAVSAASIKREVHAIDSDQPVDRILTMADFASASIEEPRFTTLLLSSFALLAVALALVGIYGVMSYTVTQRTREIGVRMALGADRRDVMRMLVRQVAAHLITGVALGLAGAAMITRVLKGLLFQVNATDPAAFAGAVAVLTLAALAAAYIPARRATRVDPMIALRYE
jgi:putative ABC transport system permease protein